MTKAANLKESFHYAVSGFAHCFRHERNFRIHLALGIVALLLALVLKVSFTELAILLLIVALVISSEMINTAVENIIDLVSPEYHPLAKVIKDVFAGAVLFVCVTAVLIGIVIFVPYLYQFLMK